MGSVKIIAASAGSGKTYRLAYEYVRSVVENPALYRHILAVTFTNKATEEMSSRILLRLHELATPAAKSEYLGDLLRDLPGFDEAEIRARARDARHRILHDYSRFAVLTIDRFFQRLIRSFMRELGVDGGFELRLETDELLELAADALIDEATTDLSVRNRILAAVSGRFEDGKRWDIRDGLVGLGQQLFSEEYQRISENRRGQFSEVGVDSEVRQFSEVDIDSDSGQFSEINENFGGRSAKNGVASAGVGAQPHMSSIIEVLVGKATAALTDVTAQAREALAVISAAGLSTEDFKGRSRSLVSWLVKVAGRSFDQTGSTLPHFSPHTSDRLFAQNSENSDVPFVPSEIQKISGAGTSNIQQTSDTAVRKIQQTFGEFLPLSAAASEAARSSNPAAWVAKGSPSRGVVEGLIPVLQPILIALETLYSENSRLVASTRLLQENHHNFLLLSDLQRHIERICREENIVPISETNRIIARLVSGNDTPFIFEKAGSCFSRFFIDEFQDTSVAQWENFSPLLQNAIASEPGSPVMLIGDIKQAIYRWRGSDWQIFSRRVWEEMGPGRVEKETLGTNYRSLQCLVEFSNNSVGRMVEVGNAALDKTISEAHAAGRLSTKDFSELTGMLAEAYRDHTQKPRDNAEGGYVTMTTYGADNEGIYTPPVIARIEDLQSRGYRAGDIAVLVRSNTQGALIARMLLEHKRLNPSSPYCYNIVTAEALTIGSSAASRFIIACLSLAVDISDTIQMAVYNSWHGRNFDSPLSRSETEFFSRIASMSPESAFEEVLLQNCMKKRTEDIAYIQAIHQQITAFCSRSVSDIPLFLKWWNEHGATASITMQEDSEAISIVTIHKSKGLEYKAVIIPYLSWPMAPDTRGRPLVVWAEYSENNKRGNNEHARENDALSASGDGILAGLGAMPINYKSEMAGSYFAARYYREQVLAQIDATNLFYVAVTRARRELHLMVSSNPRDGRGSVGNLLREALNISEGFTEWGTPTKPEQTKNATKNLVDTQTRILVDTQTSTKSLVEVSAHPDQTRASMLPGGVLRDYSTVRPETKMRLRLPATRYLEDGAMALAPRDFGVLMHRAFEGAATASDVYRTVNVMVTDALISPSEGDHLRKSIERAFENPLVGEWFSECWNFIRNEGTILLPGATASAAPATQRSNGATRRPDRVMMRDDRVVVVDYKFGKQLSEAHAVQLRDYMDVLKKMGHKHVEGYLWYVSLNRIEKIDKNKANPNSDHLMNLNN